MLDVFLTQSWVDDRLVAPPSLPPTNEVRLTLDYRWKQALWSPLLHFQHARSVQLSSLVEPVLFVSVINRNRVMISARMSIELACASAGERADGGADSGSGSAQSSSGRPETSGSYPFDRRECVLELVSREYNDAAQTKE